jgi:two-component system CheB/CheR fusion protein
MDKQRPQRHGLSLVASEGDGGKAAETAPKPGGDATVFVVEDDVEFGELLSRVLRPLGVPVKVFGSAEEFLAQFDVAASGCLLLDLRLPGMDGISLLGTVRHLGGVIPAVILTGYADIATVRRALLSGASDLLEKPVKPDYLLAAVAAGLDIDRERRHSAAVGARLSSLTSREWEVLRMVVAGKPNKIISSDLGISQKTVEAHRARLMAKAGAASVPQLIGILGAYERLPVSHPARVQL